jgi:hypothetical protein
MARAPIEVSDVRSNAPEQIEYAALAIGRSKVRLTLFEAVYHHMGAKSATKLAERAGIARERVIKEIRPLVNRKIVAAERRNEDIYYSAVPLLKAHKVDIIKYARHPAKLKTLPTKRRPSVKVTVKNNVSFSNIKIPSKSFDVRQITVDDIENFSLVGGVEGSANLSTSLSETKFKEGIQKIVQEPGTFKDWGGEKSDLFTTRLRVAGARRSAALPLRVRGNLEGLPLAVWGKTGIKGRGCSKRLLMSSLSSTGARLILRCCPYLSRSQLRAPPRRARPSGMG